MMRGWTVAALVFALLIAGSLAWRWLSRRHQLPCPAWLAWGLENPLMVRLLRTPHARERPG